MVIYMEHILCILVLLYPIFTYIFHEYFFAAHSTHQQTRSKYSVVRKTQEEIERERLEFQNNRFQERMRDIQARHLEIEREQVLEKQRARKRAKERRIKKLRKQALTELIESFAIEKQIAILDEQYGGEDHAPPEVINQMLSQFKTEFGDSPTLTCHNSATRMKIQEEKDKQLFDGFLNRI